MSELKKHQHRRKRMVIGVTGGIASGKSTVMQLLARHGFHTISSDDLAHRCLMPGHPSYKRIVKRYGSGILSRKRHIDRFRLGQIVFSQPGERQWLERQTHPYVIEVLKAFTKKHRGLIALDIPLLFEKRLERLADRTLVVACAQSDQIKRLKRRNGLTLQQAKQRIRAQLPLAVKCRRADYVLNNSGSSTALSRQVGRLVDQLKNEYKKSA
jgi:dephospho-CoA kinase